MNFTPQQVARKIAAAASDKKAKDILLLNMENLSPLTDYFVIASADEGYPAFEHGKPFPADRLFCNCQCR